MDNNNNTNDKPTLQPEITEPVTRQTTGSLFHAQPTGGVEAACPCCSCYFADDDAE